MARKKTVTAIILIMFMLPALFAGCSEKSRTLFTVNGDKVPYDEYMAHLFFAKCELFANEIQSESKSLSDIIKLDDETLETKLSNGETVEQNLKLMAEDNVMCFYVYRQIAKENNLKLTDKDKREVDAKMSSLYEMFGSAAAYNKFLKQGGTTESALRKYYETPLYYAKISGMFSEGAAYDLTEEERARAKNEYEASYVTIRQIYLATIELTFKTKLSAETIAKKRASAQEAYDKLKKGTDFDIVIDEYSEAKKNKLTFTSKDGSIDNKIREKAFEMKVGEISGIIETNEGFYIIKRDEISYDSLPAYYNIVRSRKLDSFLGQKFRETVLRYKDAYKKIEIR